MNEATQRVVVRVALSAPSAVAAGGSAVRGCCCRWLHAHCDFMHVADGRLCATSPTHRTRTDPPTTSSPQPPSDTAAPHSKSITSPATDET